MSSPRLQTSFGSSMEDFIEKIKQHPCIWDSKLISYKDFATKEAAWTDIVDECGFESVSEAKAQWKKLRDSHREALRRRRLLTHITRPWRFEAQMEFIIPHCHARDKRSYHKNHSFEVTVDHKAVSEDEIEEYAESVDYVDAGIGIKEENVDVSDVNDINSAVNEDHEPFRKKARGNDALQDLFSSFYLKTRDLPRVLQLRVQREIFDAINRAEEEALDYDPKRLDDKLS